MEAGGPAVSPSLDAIVLTPLAAQGARLRSMVLDGSEMVHIVTADRSAPLVVEVDGRTTLDMPDVKARLLELGIHADFVGGDELTEMATKDIEAWREVAKRAGITMN